MKRKQKKLHRCAICNFTSDASIATNYGEVTDGHFYPDPKDKKHVICSPCAHEIFELKAIYSIMDDTVEFNW